MDKDLDKEERNIAERGLSLDLAENLDWATALIWEDTRKDYGESTLLRAWPHRGSSAQRGIHTARWKTASHQFT